jgi:holliday junction DNA helicase RuvA
MLRPNCTLSDSGTSETVRTSARDWDADRFHRAIRLIQGSSEEFSYFCPRKNYAFAYSRTSERPCGRRVDTPSFLPNNQREMIGLLRGALVEKRPGQVIVDAGGVGYEVHIPLSTFAALGALRAEVTLLIHTHVREDQIALYGFLTAREKHLFEMLLSVSGVGPSLALKVLSGMSVDEIVPAVRRGDVAVLTRTPGVGRKTAERIIVELRDKLAAAESTAEEPRAPRSQIEEDLFSALVNLGYDRRETERALEKLRREGAPASFDAALRAALQQLSPAPTATARRAAGE